MVIANSGARFLAESRRDGALELLATTPAAGSVLLDGVRRAVTRLYRGPLYLFLASKLAFFVYLVGQELQFWGNSGFRIHFEWGQTMDYVCSTAGPILTFFAVTRVAMWFGLRSGNPVKAAVKAMGLVFLAPMVARHLLPAILGASGFWIWRVGLYLLIVKDIAFLVWANRRLKSRFNEAMTA